MPNLKDFYKFDHYDLISSDVLKCGSYLIYMINVYLVRWDIAAITMQGRQDHVINHLPYDEFKSPYTLNLLTNLEESSLTISIMCKSSRIGSK